MKYNESYVRFPAGAMRLFALAATCLLAPGAWADDAIWIGGASGDMNTAANWSSDIAASGAKMMFTNDCTVSLSADLTANSAFSANTVNTGDPALRYNKNVTINLNGYTLRTIGTENSGNHYWRARGSTLTFTGGTFLNVQDGGTTNSITADNASLSRGMSLIVTGSGTKFVSSVVNRALNDSIGTRFILKDGASAFGGTFAFGGVCSTNEIKNSSLTFANDLLVGAAGRAEASHNNNYGFHDTILTISGSTVTSENGRLSVGHGFRTGYVGYANGSCNNSLLAENGSTVSVKYLDVGTYGANSNNTIVVKGEGSSLSVAGQTRIGAGTANSEACGVCRDNSLVITNGARATFSVDHVYVPYTSGGAVDNRFVVSDGAYALVEKCIILGMYGTNNTVVVSSGATLESSNTSIFYLGHEGSGYGARLEIDGGNVSFTNQISIGQANYAGAHEVFVGNGGTLFSKTIAFKGIGDKLVVSNGTVTASTFDVGSGMGASGTTIRVEGKSALVSFETWLNQEEYPHGAPVFEFVIPEGGWALAPIRSNRAFSLPANVTLRIDAEAVAAYLKANPRGGTIPLMRTGDSSRAITVADMDALSANLPDGCSLANESGVLSLKIKSGLGLTLIVY